MQGCILDGTNNFFTIKCDDNILRVCSIKGKILKSDERLYNPLSPGDIVEIEIDKLDDEKGQILTLLPRKNTFVRWNIKKRAAQLLASNIDYIALVTTPCEPPFRPRFIDRAIVQAERENITPIIVCNKIDLQTEKDEEFIKRIKIWENLGYKIICVSAKTGFALKELSSIIENKLTAFVGQSGVGKSSLINALSGNDILRTGKLSQKYERGAHTTTKGSLNEITFSKELFQNETKKAKIIDTPGIRRFILHDIQAEDIALYFKEFKDFLGKCTFGMSCTHTHEAGCKILEALENNIITKERYDSWQRITKEIKTQDWE